MATQAKREYRAGEVAAMHAEAIARKLLDFVVSEPMTPGDASVSHPQ